MNIHEYDIYVTWCDMISAKCNLMQLASNVTGCHRGRKRKLRAGYRAPSLQERDCEFYFYFYFPACCVSSSLIFYVLDVLDCNARHIFHRRVWRRALSLRCARTGRSRTSSSSPIGYLCANFRFFGGLHCSTEKNRIHSLARLPCSLFWCSGNRNFASESSLNLGFNCLHIAIQV